MPGVRGVVVIGDFVGVVAEREEQAIRAAKALRVRWRPLPRFAGPDRAFPRDRRLPAKRRLLQESGNVDAAAREPGATTFTRRYAWPYQMHGSIGPSCALADYRDDGVTVWAGTQNPQTLRYDLARLAGRDEADVEIVRMEAAGCYGRNCADDVAGDALLLSRAMRRPCACSFRARTNTCGSRKARRR